MLHQSWCGRAVGRPCILAHAPSPTHPRLPPPPPPAAAARADWPLARSLAWFILSFVQLLIPSFSLIFYFLSTSRSSAAFWPSELREACTDSPPMDNLVQWGPSFETGLGPTVFYAFFSNDLREVLCWCWFMCILFDNKSIRVLVTRW